MNDLLRELAPQVLGVLVRRHGRFEECEDAVQEALLAAAQQWGRTPPEHPKAWLITVAERRLTDAARSDIARRRREDAVAAEPPPPPPGTTDDTLTLLRLCCHPTLTPASQIALTLRAVGGLTTEQIASAFLVPEATMAQRISRAKKQLRGRPLDTPGDLSAVLHVLYLIFNEGYTDLEDTELAREAIRLTRMVRALAPGDGEVAGLLALMLLTDARRPARTTPEGELVPLAAQDRTRWERAKIEEGVALITETLRTAVPGPYQLQAAIAAVHAEAATANDTDWPQILALYDVLERLAPGPMVTLNRAVAVAMVRGPRAGLAALDDALEGHHRLYAVRAHLLELAGEREEANAAYREAARRTKSIPERRYLEGKVARP
jgi:RNA polymerase sigma factor (sigma-70 family)